MARIRDASPEGDRVPSGSSLVRWVALAFLVADSTDIVAGLVAPSEIIPRPDAFDVVQTLLGLVACALLMWQRWRWATLCVAVLVVLMLTQDPVGIEAEVLVVGAVVVGAGGRRGRILVGLAAGLGYCAVLGWAFGPHDGAVWARATALAAAAMVVAGAVGMFAGRLGRQREESWRVLRQIEADNLRIRRVERLELAEELEVILRRDFATMTATTEAIADSDDVDALRRGIVRLGDLSRAVLASTRLALRTLREELTPPVPAPRHGTGWIEVLYSRPCRLLVQALCALAAVVAAGQAAYAIGTGEDLTGAGVLGLVAGTVLCPLTVLLALSRGPQPALWLGGVSAVLASLAPTASPWLAFPVALGCFLAAHGRRWPTAVVTVGLVLGLMAIQMVVHGAAAYGVVAVLEVVGMASALLGLTLSHFELARSRAAASLEALLGQRTRIAEDERTSVAREMHDVVGHQFSLVSLRSLGAESTSDPEALRELVDHIRGALDAARVEIDGLVGALRSAAGEIGDHQPEVVPTVVGVHLGLQMREAGRQAKVVVDPRVDDLDPTTRRTLTRLLQESSTNVLRHGPPGAEYVVRVSVDDQAVTLTASSTPPVAGAAATSPSGGFGLRGMRERVDLTGGSFSAGLRNGAWRVEARLPVVENAGRRPRSGPHEDAPALA